MSSPMWRKAQLLGKEQCRIANNYHVFHVLGKLITYSATTIMMMVLSIRRFVRQVRERGRELLMIVKSLEIPSQPSFVTSGREREK